MKYNQWKEDFNRYDEYNYMYTKALLNEYDSKCHINAFKELGELELKENRFELFFNKLKKREEEKKNMSFTQNLIINNLKLYIFIISFLIIKVFLLLFIALKF